MVFYSLSAIIQPGQVFQLRLAIQFGSAMNHLQKSFFNRNYRDGTSYEEEDERPLSRRVFWSVAFANLITRKDEIIPRFRCSSVRQASRYCESSLFQNRISRCKQNCKQHERERFVLDRRNDGIIPSAIRWWLSSEMLLDVWLTECSQLSNILRILHFPIINSFTPIEKIKSNVIELNIRSVYNIFICSNKKLQVEVKKENKERKIIPGWSLILEGKRSKEKAEREFLLLSD